MQNTNNKVFKIHQMQICLGLSKGSILTYCALCRAADKEGLSSPSIANMELDTGIARRSIFRNLLQLKGQNLIRQEGEKDGVTIYRVTRRGAFVLCPWNTLDEIKTLSKARIIAHLEKMSPPTQKNVTPQKQENDTPKREKMAPIIDNYKLTTNSIVNVKEKVSPPKNDTPPQELTITEFNAFNALWNRYSADPVSMWTSPDPVKEFLSILKTHKGVLKKKDLTTEIRVLDAYMLELRYKRLKSYDSPYKGSPIIYHGKGWLKCLDRWLSSKNPASITPQRRSIISTYGIQFEEMDTPPVEAPKQAIPQKPVKAPTKASSALEYPSTAKKELERATGCNTLTKWLRYMVSKEKEFPNYEERANFIMRDAMSFDEKDIEFIMRSDVLLDLASLVSLRPSNAPMFYRLAELEKWGL